MHDRSSVSASSSARAARAKEFTELARQAEALGYSTLFVPDHFVDHDLAPTVALAHAAAVTDTLRVGPLVLGNDYKHPVVLAREVATLDLLSDGRLELGIGAGWMTADYEKAGMPLDRPGVRIARLAESITILKGLFADGPFTFHGEHYRVTELDGQPKPVQRPHPPFFIGGGGQKILGARGARGADRRHQREPALGRRQLARRRAVAHAGRDRPEARSGCARPRASGFDDLEIQTLVGFVHVTDDATRIARGDGRESFGVSTRRRAARAGRRSSAPSRDRRPARGAARALADELHGRAPRIDGAARAGRRPARRNTEY